MFEIRELHVCVEGLSDARSSLTLIYRYSPLRLVQSGCGGGRADVSMWRCVVFVLPHADKSYVRCCLLRELLACLLGV